MLSVKFLNLFVLLLIFIALYNLFFGIDSKKNFLALQDENQELILKNKILTEENNLLENEIQSKQKNDAYAEKFAREELNLIYQDEHFLKFKEKKPNEPDR
jgi:cell division protein FtsB|tara:strand:+ start:207 stop:509 length:303 start_codon:yes stop_codon:yes gene_type:complete